MNHTYPDKHHPVFFLINALNAIGIRADFTRDERTLGCWGMVFPDFNNRVLVWLIDNRWIHEAQKEDPAARYLLDNGNAIVCHAQRRDMERVGGVYLPLAVTPGFEPLKVKKTADCAFVGYIRDHDRTSLLARVGAKYKLNLAQGVFGKAATETYCSAHVGIHIPTRYSDPVAYDIPMRPYEIAACGIPLVTNALPELAELGFVNRQTCFTYEPYPGVSITDAVQCALSHPEIGEAGYQLVQEKHLYSHRAEQVKQWLTC